MQLWTMNSDGTDKREVPTPSDISDPDQPDWSPDGTEFALLARLQGGQYGLWVMGIDGAVMSPNVGLLRYNVPPEECLHSSRIYNDAIADIVEHEREAAARGSASVAA